MLPEMGRNSTEYIHFQHEEDKIMKKINTNHDNKDRIICVSELGKHKFYIILLAPENASGSLTRRTSLALCLRSSASTGDALMESASA